MEEALEALKVEIETIKRMVNGYLSTNTALAGYELDTLTIMRTKDLRDNNGPALKNADNVQNDHPGIQQRDCKICVDGQGHPYCYYGPNGCPKK